MLEQVRIPEAAQVLSRHPAPAVRRHAPARHDRDGAVVQAAAAHRRRADDRARRDDPGADPGTHPPAAAGNAHVGRVHHARHGRRRRSRRPRARHVSRRNRRGWHGDRRSSTRRDIRIRVRCSPPCRGWDRCAAATRRRGFLCPMLHRPSVRLRPRLAPLARAIVRYAAAEGARPEDAFRGAFGVLQSSAPSRPRGRAGQLRPGRGRDAGAGRRIGLRQVDHRPLAAAPGRHRPRQHRVRRARHRPAIGRRDAAAAPAKSRWCSRIRSPRSIRG